MFFRKKINVNYQLKSMNFLNNPLKYQKIISYHLWFKDNTVIHSTRHNDQSGPLSFQLWIKHQVDTWLQVARLGLQQLTTDIGTSHLSSVYQALYGNDYVLTGNVFLVYEKLQHKTTAIVMWINSCNLTADNSYLVSFLISTKFRINLL